MTKELTQHDSDIFDNLTYFNYSGRDDKEGISEYLADIEKDVSIVKRKGRYGESLMGSLNIEILKKVHSLGGNVNDDTNSKGMRMTVLSNACYWGESDIVKYLLENGADPLKKSEYNECSLCYSMSNISGDTKSNIEIIDLLIKHINIDINDFRYLRDENSKGYDLLELSLCNGNYFESLHLVKKGFVLKPKHIKRILENENPSLNSYDEEEDYAFLELQELAKAQTFLEEC